MNLLELARVELFRSNVDRKHPFRLLYLSTWGEYPEVRIVVKRNIDPYLNFTFFTDSRSPKVEQIRNNPKVSALFYHPKKKLQIRLYGQAILIDEGHGDFDRYLQAVKQSSSLQDYTTIQAPGSALKLEAEAASLFGKEIYFLAVEIQAQKLDILQLGRENHRRSVFLRQGYEWSEQVLVP